MSLLRLVLTPLSLPGSYQRVPCTSMDQVRLCVTPIPRLPCWSLSTSPPATQLPRPRTLPLDPTCDSNQTPGRHLTHTLRSPVPTHMGPFHSRFCPCTEFPPPGTFLCLRRLSPSSSRRHSPPTFGSRTSGRSPLLVVPVHSLSQGGSIPDSSGVNSRTPVIVLVEVT